MKKPFKEIDIEIKEQIKRIREKGRSNQELFPSFIGMQLNKIMNFDTSEEKMDMAQQKSL